MQLWTNVPKANKWDTPAYQLVKKEQQPEVMRSEGVVLRLVSGINDGKTGPMKTHTPVIFVIGSIAKDKAVSLKATPGYWTLRYIIKERPPSTTGMPPSTNLIVFEKENDEIGVVAKTDTQVLFMPAEPIHEPVAA